MNIDNFKPGDLLVITSKSKQGGRDVVERRASQVTWVNHKGNGLVSYTPPDVNSDRYAQVFGADVTLSTGSGAFNPSDYNADGARANLATKPYGLAIEVKKVGYQNLWRPSSINLFRNPGYDLVNL